MTPQRFQYHLFHWLAWKLPLAAGVLRVLWEAGVHWVAHAHHSNWHPWDNQEALGAQLAECGCSGWVHVGEAILMFCWIALIVSGVVGTVWAIFRTVAGINDRARRSEAEPEPECIHDNLRVEILDQSMGVVCADCGTVLAYCWDDEHISEQLWNQACADDPEEVSCDENRPNYCALCGEKFEVQ